MKISYAPADGEAREWLWRPAEMDSVEAELIEDVMDLPYAAFVSKFLSGSTRARRALLWVLLRRDTPALRFEQVRFRMNEVGDDFDDRELAAMRASLDEPGDGDPLDDAARDRIREVLAERDAADAVAADLAGVAPGKDTADVDAPASTT